jgi:hypothetical protein
MTKADFTQKINELLTNDGNIKEVIFNACMGVINSPYTQSSFLDKATNDFIFPKAVLSTVLTQLAWQYEPIDKENKKLIPLLKPHVSFSRIPTTPPAKYEIMQWQGVKNSDTKQTTQGWLWIKFLQDTVMINTAPNVVGAKEEEYKAGRMVGFSLQASNRAQGIKKFKEQYKIN